MRPEEYAKMYHLEGTYWWFQGRKKIVTRLLDELAPYREGKARVLDLGCGPGLMLETMAHRQRVVGLDFSPLAPNFSRRRGVEPLVQGDAERVPLASRSFDIVTALDLAEHVEHDDLLFSEAFRVLKPGGHLVLTVPAHPFLWSDHDDALYHCRRYRRRELRRKILDAGFELRRLSYCITFTFPMIVAFRVVQRALQRPGHPKTHLITLPAWANRVLMASVELEAALLRYVGLPFGITLLAVARRPG